MQIFNVLSTPTGIFMLVSYFLLVLSDDVFISPWTQFRFSSFIAEINKKKNGSNFCQYAREEVSSLVKLELTKSFMTKYFKERESVQNFTDTQQHMNEKAVHYSPRCSFTILLEAEKRTNIYKKRKWIFTKGYIVLC